MRREDLARRIVEPRRCDRFHEELCHLRRGIAIDRAIDANDSAERRHRIAFQRALVGFGQRTRDRRAAGIGVLDDRADRLLKLLRQVPRRLQIDDVVVAEFLALKLLAVGDALPRAVGIQRRLLMRVFAVAQIEAFCES